MIEYIDVRFEVDADSQQEAIDIVTREVNEIFDEHYAHKDGPIMTPPYVIAATSADSVEDTEYDLEEVAESDLEEGVEAINLFDLYRAVRNEVKL